METLFRAREAGESKYVEGHLVSPTLLKPLKKSWTIDKTKKPYCVDVGYVVEIDPSTRSIHYSTMTDMEDNKVFASLDEDGVGGDIVEDEDGIRFVCLILNNSLCFIDLQDGYLIDDKHSTDWVKVVGIKDE